MTDLFSQFEEKEKSGENLVKFLKQVSKNGNGVNVYQVWVFGRGTSVRPRQFFYCFGDLIYKFTEFKSC